MKANTIKESKFFKTAAGAVLTALCGLLLWKMPLGESWINASYDYLFRPGSRSLTNNVVLILMDNDAYDHFHQTREDPWDRALHAQLLQRLAADDCAMVVFDSFFRAPRDQETDDALAHAMTLPRHVVLMAEQAQVTHPELTGAHPALPAGMFLKATGTNWGVAWLDPDVDSIVRHHWPFPSPGPYPSLPRTVARLAGARLSEIQEEKWLRYYGPRDAWARMSYRFAMTQPTNYFRDKIVFVGNQPKTSVADNERDEFLTPYSRWTGETTGGVEILITSFLNLLNGDWLRRPPPWLEATVLVVLGILIGGLLTRVRSLKACAIAVTIAILITIAGVAVSHFSNYWFPWLVIAGGQVPCALTWALATAKAPARPASEAVVEELPDTPGYELFDPPFGRGSYGKVWVARNAVGQWQALKVIYRASFGENADPYDREFNGISRYKPVSDKHPGLLRVDFVSNKEEKYFYYVMELGDPLTPGWEHEPSTYKPRDLAGERARSTGSRLPVRECLRIGLALTDTLAFLHEQGLTHRDIKPQNIIFVNGQPKLADMGLIAEIRPPDEEGSFVGTPGYMPPPPELPGTPPADIYALGMVLYVLSTGRNAAFFPEISTTIAGAKDHADYFPFNTVILKACHPDAKQRYASAAEMRQALLELDKIMDSQSPPPANG